MGTPLEMVEDQVRLDYPGVATYEVHPLGPNLFVAMMYSSEGPDQELQATSLATYKIKATVVGEPILLSVAQREV